MTQYTKIFYCFFSSKTFTEFNFKNVSMYCQCFVFLFRVHSRNPVLRKPQCIINILNSLNFVKVYEVKSTPKFKVVLKQKKDFLKFLVTHFTIPPHKWVKSNPIHCVEHNWSPSKYKGTFSTIYYGGFLSVTQM